MHGLGSNSVENPVFISFFTPSHKDIFLNCFLASFRELFSFKYNLVVKCHEQHCETGDWHTSGWRKTQSEKLSYVIEQVEKLKDGQVFIFCDADVLNLKDYTGLICDKLKAVDLVAQNSFKDRSICSEGCGCIHTKVQIEDSICSGFYAARKSDKVLSLLKKVLSDLLSEVGKEETADQHFLNRNKSSLRYEILDELFFNPGFSSVGRRVEKNDFLDNIKICPKEPYIVHANWMVGCETKVEYINFFLSKKTLRGQFLPKIKLVTTADSYELDIDHMLINNSIEFFIFHKGENRKFENVHFLSAPNDINLYDAEKVKEAIGDFSNYGIFNPNIRFLEINWLFPYHYKYDLITQSFNCRRGLLDNNLIILKNTPLNLNLLKSPSSLASNFRRNQLSFICTNNSNKDFRRDLKLYEFF